MHNYLRLLRYARPQRASFVLISVLTLAGAGLAALQPWPMKLLIDEVLLRSAHESKLEIFLQRFGFSSTPVTFLWIATLGGLILFALNAAVDCGLVRAWTAAGRRMVYDLAQDLFARLQRRSLLFHKRNAVGDILGRVTVDSWCVYQIVDALLFTPVHAILTMGLMFFLMMQLDATLALWALAVAPLMVGASFLMGKPLRAAAKLKREIESRIQAHIQQTLTGIPVVQAYAQEERESLRFQSFAEAAIRSQQRSALLGSINSLTSGLIAALGSGVILWIGARRVLNGDLSIGSILVFLVYLNSLQAQMKVLAGLYATIHGLSANVHRVIEVLDTAPEVVESLDAISPGAVRGQVQFDHVTAEYEPGRPVLKSITFDAQPGEAIAIVGATGAGKTTLVNLIPRFADPSQGRVLVDGRDARDLRLKPLRDQVAIVLQESLLFPLSVADNIAYGKPDASREQIEQAARAANAHEFITRLPEGYDTVIGERGATLSGGERQRLAIARAILKNPPILILDEPTSALDADTERLILDALQRLMKDRTTFIIAHRLSTVRHADRIVVLKDGEIAEMGTHAELLARRGQYARLHEIQTEATTHTATLAT
jgi:ABC-type multidrug transport system fused ATPase/permease subunit